MLGRALGLQRRSAEWGDSTPPPPGAPLTAAGGAGTDPALRVATALSCVLAVSEDLGMLPLNAYRTPRSGAGVLPVQPVPQIVADPFAEDDTNVSRQTGIAQLVMSLLLRGNGYGLVADRGAGDQPTALVVANPDRIRCRVEHGERVYRVNGQRIPTADVVHVLGPSLPGEVTGLSVIEYQRVLFALGGAIGDFSLGWFQRGISPSGVLKTSRALNKKQARELSEAFAAAHAGVGRSHGVGVLSGGIEYQPLSLKPEDSAWLETMSLVREDICGIFGVPPWRVGIRAGEAGPGSGAVLDASGAAYLRHTILRWTTRLEHAWTRMIPGGLTYCEFDLSKFTRADATTRWKNYMLGRTVGAITNAEIRASENLPPIDDPSMTDPAAPLNSAHATAGDAGPAAGLDAPPAPEQEGT